MGDFIWTFLNIYIYIYGGVSMLKEYVQWTWMFQNDFRKISCKLKWNLHLTGRLVAQVVIFSARCSRWSSRSGTSCSCRAAWRTWWTWRMSTLTLTSPQPWFAARPTAPPWRWAPLTALPQDFISLDFSPLLLFW